MFATRVVVALRAARPVAPPLDAITVTHHRTQRTARRERERGGGDRVCARHSRVVVALTAQETLRDEEHAGDRQRALVFKWTNRQTIKGIRC